MPFIRDFGEGSDELGTPTPPPDTFVYEPSKGKLVASRVGPSTTVLLEWLRRRGASRVRVDYDGGFDEGFAHIAHVVIGEATIAPEQLAKDVAAEPALLGRLRDTAPKMYRSMSMPVADETVALNELDELAHKIASLLLGSSYGTGMYELYGSLTLDLHTGEITDDPEAKPIERGD